MYEKGRPLETSTSAQTGAPYYANPMNAPCSAAAGITGQGEITPPSGPEEPYGAFPTPKNTPRAEAAAVFTPSVEQISPSDLAAQLTDSGELLDIVDRDGNPTGQRAGKNDIHQNGLWHRDVHVWVTDGVHILEQQRTHDKKIMPGAWDVSVAGHVAAGESYLDAAWRETAEEIGLQIPAKLFRPSGRLAIEMAMEDGAWMHRTVGDNFVVLKRDLRLADLRLQESEVADVRLYPIDQLEADLQDPETAVRHAPQPLSLWQLGIAAMRAAARDR